MRTTLTIHDQLFAKAAALAEPWGREIRADQAMRQGAHSAPDCPPLGRAGRAGARY